MPTKRDLAYLLTQATRCRRLARNTSDEMAARELLALAVELECKANSDAMPSHQSGGIRRHGLPAEKMAVPSGGENTDQISHISAVWASSK